MWIRVLFSYCVRFDQTDVTERDTIWISRSFVSVSSGTKYLLPYRRCNNHCRCQPVIRPLAAAGLL